MTGSEHEEQASRAHEPTTMRLPGIGGLEQIDTGAEAEVALSKADQATVDALRTGTALLVVLRGPNTGRGSSSTTTRSTPVATPTATSSSTT